MFRMAYSRENDASNHMENLPDKSSAVQQNEKTEFQNTHNVITVSSSDSSNEKGNMHDGDISSTHETPIVNKVYSPNYTDLVGNTVAAVPSNVQDMTTSNSDNTIGGATLFNNFQSSQMAKNSLNIGGNTASGVSLNNLGGRVPGTSQIHNFMADDDDSLNLAALLNGFNSSQTDESIINMGDNVAAGAQSNSHCDTALDIKPAQIFTFNGGNTSSVADQLNYFQKPQINRNFLGIGGNSAAGVRLNNQCGTGSGDPYLHGATVNPNDVRFSSQLNNFHGPHVQGSSMNIGNSTAAGTQSFTRGGTTADISSVHHLMLNNDNVNSVTSPSNNFHSPQFKRRAINIGGNRAAGLQANSQDEAVTFMSHVHGVTVDGDNYMSASTLSNNLQGSEINRSCTTGGNVTAGVRGNIQNKAVPTNLRSNALLPDRVYESVNERNPLCGGGTMYDVHQIKLQERLMANNVMANNDQANTGPSTEQIDNSFLSLAFGPSGGDSASGLQSNVLGTGNSRINSWPMVTHQSYDFCGPPSDGCFLSLGGSMGDQIQSNNGNKPISDTNAGANPDPLGMPHMLPGDVQNYFPTPSSRTLGIGHNRGVMYTNMHPNSGFQGHFGMGPRPLGSIPAGFHATEQVRLPRVAPTPTNVMGIPNGSVPTQLQQAYLNQLRSIPTYPPVVSPLARPVQRTIGQYNSGQPVPLDGVIAAHATKEVTNPSAKGTQAQTAQHVSLRDSVALRDALAAQAAKARADLAAKIRETQAAQGKTRVPSRGKRGSAAEAGQSAQSAKVLLGSSASGGKPVPIAGHVGVAQTNENVLLRQPILSKIRPTSATLPVPHQKLTPQLSYPSVLAGGTFKPPDHIKWKGSLEESSPSIGENCQICKRDLIFTPTGPVTQPAIPPEVAVLPCGHTFHDECLERITPAEQAKDPPCIPCAIGTS